MARVKKNPETEPEAPITQSVDAVELSQEISAESEIPESVKRILKVFSRYPQLWVDNSGGVFVNKPNAEIGAILYKNPYAEQA